MLQVTLVSPRAKSVTMLHPTHSNLGTEFQVCVLDPHQHCELASCKGGDCTTCDYSRCFWSVWAFILC